MRRLLPLLALFLLITQLAAVDSLRYKPYSAEKFFTECSSDSIDASVHLFLNMFGLTSEEVFVQINNLGSSECLGKVRAITVVNGEFDSILAKKLFGAIDNIGLTHFTMRSCKIKSKNSTFFRQIGKELVSMRIIESDLPEDFFVNMLQLDAPHLENLEIVSSGLKRDIIDHLKEWKHLVKLRSLNLSENKLSNKILTIFPLDSVGQLETLKLNYCEIDLATNRKYSKKFPYVCSNTSPGYGINWSSPYFTNLKHLELEDDTKLTGAALKIIDEQGIRALDVFIGFRQELPINIEDEKFLRRRAIMFKRYDQAGLASRRCNYRLLSLNDVDVLAKMGSAERLENLLFFGTVWRQVAIKTVLDQQAFPALRYVDLHLTATSEKEVYELIKQYPQYQFTVVGVEHQPDTDNVYTSGAQYWPKLDSGDE